MYMETIRTNPAPFIKEKVSGGVHFLTGMCMRNTVQGTLACQKQSPQQQCTDTLARLHGSSLGWATLLLHTSTELNIV